MPEAWIKTTSVNLAAAVATLGVPVKSDQTTDVRSGKSWKTLLLGLESLPRTEIGLIAGEDDAPRAVAVGNHLCTTVMIAMTMGDQHVADLCRIEAGGWLVDDDQLWVAEQRLVVAAGDALVLSRAARRAGDRLGQHRLHPAPADRHRDAGEALGRSARRSAGLTPRTGGAARRAAPCCTGYL